MQKSTRSFNLLKIYMRKDEKGLNGIKLDSIEKVYQYINILKNKSNLKLKVNNGNRDLKIFKKGEERKEQLRTNNKTKL